MVYHDPFVVDHVIEPGKEMDFSRSIRLYRFKTEPEDLTDPENQSFRELLRDEILTLLDGSSEEWLEWYCFGKEDPQLIYSLSMKNGSIYSLVDNVQRQGGASTPFTVDSFPFRFSHIAQKINDAGLTNITTLKLVYSSCGYVLFIDCAQGEYTLTDTTHYNVIPEVYGGKTQVLLGDTIYPATEYLVFHSNRLKDMDAFYRAHNDPATPAPNITYTENSLSLYQNAPSPYPDVSSELAPHVAQLKDLGVISGMPDGLFHPQEPVTRRELAVMLCRLGMLELSGNSSFPDVADTDWAAGAIGALADAQIISGYPDGSFHPDDPVVFSHALRAMVFLLGDAARVSYNRPIELAETTQRAIERNLLRYFSSLDLSSTLTRGDTALLLSAAADSPVFTMLSTSENGFNGLNDITYYDLHQGRSFTGRRFFPADDLDAWYESESEKYRQENPLSPEEELYERLMDQYYYNGTE